VSLRANGWGENSILLLQSKKDDIAVLARIKSTSVRRNDARLVCEAKLSCPGRNLVGFFHKSSDWTAVELFSLTTTAREYQSLVTLHTIPLGREILRPRYVLLFYNSISVDRSPTIILLKTT
jgi:hypothetical protein